MVSTWPTRYLSPFCPPELGRARSRNAGEGHVWRMPRVCRTHVSLGVCIPSSMAPAKISPWHPHLRDQAASSWTCSTMLLQGLQSHGRSCPLANSSIPAGVRLPARSGWHAKGPLCRAAEGDGGEKHRGAFPRALQQSAAALAGITTLNALSADQALAAVSQVGVITAFQLKQNNSLPNLAAQPSRRLVPA